MSVTKTTTARAVKAHREKNWAIPGQVASLEEVQAAIKSAENGAFMTVQESMNDFEQWLKSREKMSL